MIIIINEICQWIAILLLLGLIKVLADFIFEEFDRINKQAWENLNIFELKKKKGDKE